MTQKKFDASSGWPAMSHSLCLVARLITTITTMPSRTAAKSFARIAAWHGKITLFFSRAFCT